MSISPALSDSRHPMSGLVPRMRGAPEIAGKRLKLYVMRRVVCDGLKHHGGQCRRENEPLFHT